MSKNQKTLVSLVLVFVMAFMPLTTTVNNDSVNAATNEIVNLALNKPVTTSSNEHSSLAGEYAVDGDSTTRWSSIWTDGEWIMVDLGAIYTVGSIVIEWEDAYASTYSIYWSQDNVSWFHASTSNVHSAEVTQNMFFSRPVRYIKVVCDKRATNYGASIYELKVMGYSNPVNTEPETTTEAVTEPETTTQAASSTTNLALGKYVLSSSNETDDYLAANAVDGNYDTRWASAFRDGEWIMVDLGDVYTVGCVNIAWEDAYASTYTILWSLDNITWNTSSTRTISSPAKTTDMFFNRPVRYIKVVGDKRATEYGISMYELEVIGNNTPVVTETETTTETVTEVETTTEVVTEPETTTEEAISPTTNLALGKPVVSSSDEDSSLSAANAVDGDSDTRWSSAFKEGQWIMVDLGKLYNVSSMTIDWEDAFASQYMISWSQDNITWHDAITFGTSTASSQTHMMYGWPARYIKITSLRRATSYGISIYEIKVFGSEYDPDYKFSR